MKKYLYPLLLLLTSSLFLPSCSPTMNYRIPIQVPPKLVLPDNVQKVGIVNRSMAADERNNQVVNVLEGVVTGEGLYEDRNGSIACLAGAQTQLNTDQLVDAKILDTLLRGTGTGLMPLPLSWTEVGRLCKSEGVDALLVLEVFDTDQAGSTTANTLGQIRNIAEGGQVRPPVGSTNPRVYVKMAWRLYDPVARAIIDEVRMDDYFGVASNGGVLPDLGEFGKRDAIQQSGYLAGRAWGDRLFPGTVTLWREFYVRRGPDLKRTARMVELNDFARAVPIWEVMSRKSKRKFAGRACFNLALAAEVNGEIDTAIEWANKAYSDFGEKRARVYARNLAARR